MYFYGYKDFNIGNLIIHFLALQSFTTTSLLNYWFVSIILIYYIMYPIVIYLSKMAKDIAIIFLFITAIIICAYVVSHNIDTRIYIYLMIFAAGIIARKIEVFEHGKIQKFIPLLLICLLTALAINILFFNNGNFLVHGFFLNGVILLSFIVTHNVLVISLCLLLFWIVSKYGSLGWSKKLLLQQISYCSYAAYLFDTVCFAIIWMVAISFGINGYLFDLVILIIAFPLVFIIAYYIQRLESDVSKILLNLVPIGLKAEIDV